MEILNKKTVHIKDHEHVQNIILELAKGGADQLQVIADFDFTLSRAHKDGRECDSLYGVLEQAPCQTEEFRYQTLSLYNHYHPIEVDPHLTKDEKTPFQIEWSKKSAELLQVSRVSKDNLSEVVKSSNAHLREGCDELLESLNKHSVPLLIFSAGVGDVLRELLVQRNLLLPNIKLVANFLKFDEKNKMLGFKNDLIHSYNKSRASIQNSEYFNKLKSRSNIILLGDSLGDPDMSAGAANVNVILKIGFLNNKIEQSLPSYMDSFDFVLTDDQTMDVANGILEKIL